MAVTRSQKNGDVSSSEQPRETTDGTDKSGDSTLSASEKKVLRTVFISLVIDLLAFTVILPLLPSLLDYYGTKEVGQLWSLMSLICI
jgi:hypothetical protein